MRRDGALTYDVAFPGGGVAPLGERARSELGRWIDRVTLVDQTLRAYGVPRVREGETACLRGYDGADTVRAGAVWGGVGGVMDIGSLPTSHLSFDYYFNILNRHAQTF